MANENGVNKYKKWAFYLSLVSLVTTTILTVVNLYLVIQIVEIRRTGLELQDAMYNFDSIIVPDADIAILNDPSVYSRQDGILVKTTHYGYLNVSIQVITPHYGSISIKLKNLNVGDSPMLDSEKRNQTEISYAFEEDEYEFPVVAGLNQISANLHLKALVYPNPETLPPQGELEQFLLGRLFLEAELFDIQTERIFSKEFSAIIAVVMDAGP